MPHLVSQCKFDFSKLLKGNVLFNHSSLFMYVYVFRVWCFKVHFLYLSRDRVRERNEGRSPPSSAVPDSTVGLRSPCKQVLLVPLTGEDFRFNSYFQQFML